LSAETGGDVEVVRRFFEALVAGVEGAASLMRPDVVYVEDPKWPGGGSYEGRQSVVDCWSRYDELLGEGAVISVLESREGTAAIAAVVRVSGRTRETGVPYDHTWGYEFRIDDGEVAYFRAYFSPAEAFEAAGAGPPAA
jgi:ketosteroid isomerase-like protein